MSFLTPQSKPPADLTDVARKKWREMTAEDAACGPISSFSADALGEYCRLFARKAHAESEITKHGELVAAPNGFPVESPWLRVAAQSRTAMSRILAEIVASAGKKRAPTSATRKGNGMGWGGAVKGASAAQADLPEFPAGNPGYAGKWPVTDRRIERENRADYLIDHIGMIAETAEREETQLAASLAYIERVRGKVPQTNLNIPGDLTDLTPDAMRAELERIGRKEAISEAGTVAPSVPD